MVLKMHFKYFKDLNHCCFIYIDDVLVFSKNHRTAQRWCLSSHPEMHWSWYHTWQKQMHLCWIRNWVLRPRDKSWTNHLTKIYSLEKENFPEKIEDRKQLERFIGCLTYTSNFIKDLAKLRKPLQQKLNKELSWTL